MRSWPTSTSTGATTNWTSGGRSAAGSRACLTARSSPVIRSKKDKSNVLTSAIAKLKAEQWSEEEIANLLLGQTKKEQLKLFSDGRDTTPVHGGAVDIPAVMADGTKNY